jgi:hypothetical protein
MEIRHNVALSVNDQRRAGFGRAGVELETGFSSFQMSENDPRWAVVSRLVQLYEAVDMASTSFTQTELDSADYLAVSPAWHHGYPESAGDNGYLAATFDLTDYCKVCGSGLHQIAPFRMKKAPSWGTKSILQLNWIFDEYFVKPEVWSAVFEPLGVGCRPVVLHRTGETIDSVVQLDIPILADMNMDGFPFEICPTCGVKKYASITRGFFPKPRRTGAAVFKSSEYFGSGHVARKLVVVSSQLYRLITDAGLKGVIFEPCAQ